MLEALTIKAVSVERTVDVLGLFVKSGQVVHNLRKTCWRNSAGQTTSEDGNGWTFWIKTLLQTEMYASLYGCCLTQSPSSTIYFPSRFQPLQFLVSIP